jgi:hypothetical protein
MPPETHRLYRVLQSRVGKHNAISMLSLYERWSGKCLERDAHGKPIEDVPTLSRRMRQFIDDLRDIYGVPVMSSVKYGYWLCASQEELDEVVHEFRARGLKSLTTSARLKRISVPEEIHQLEIALHKGEFPTC